MSGLKYWRDLEGASEEQHSQPAKKKEGKKKTEKRKTRNRKCLSRGRTIKIVFCWWPLQTRRNRTQLLQWPFIGICSNTEEMHGSFFTQHRTSKCVSDREKRQKRHRKKDEIHKSKEQ